MRRSEIDIDRLLQRIKAIGNIKSSLIAEVNKLGLLLEKTKSEAAEKLRRTNENNKEIVRFLNRGFETERLGFQNTTEVLRKLEHTLRETVNKQQNAEKITEVLTADLKDARILLHKCQKEFHEQVSSHFVYHSDLKLIFNQIARNWLRTR